MLSGSNNIRMDHVLSLWHCLALLLLAIFKIYTRELFANNINKFMYCTSKNSYLLKSLQYDILWRNLTLNSNNIFLKNKNFSPL